MKNSISECGQYPQSLYYVCNFSKALKCVSFINFVNSIRLIRLIDVLS